MACKCAKCAKQLTDDTPPKEYHNHVCPFGEGERGRIKYPIGLVIRLVSSIDYLNIPLHALATIKGYKHNEKGECGVVVDSEYAQNGMQIYLPEHIIYSYWKASVKNGDL